ncbi:Protein Rf1, mitochondrial [Zancudomyces culisetae]|uniref:Protein Rf1, mitochondrial n=1 Tax=Zancudomyces culisetae TaxID=1213189 RepID=A0A1R1PBX2_ZANCU|nr:Protein Rf1, mitochondrial [Zancudomyces culisetae]|eukprot:OMH78464.1 Protein Rf1, mitochondrial [Zancudomyces culisetae]
MQGLMWGYSQKSGKGADETGEKNRAKTRNVNESGNENGNRNGKGNGDTLDINTEITNKCDEQKGENDRKSNENKRLLGLDEMAMVLEKGVLNKLKDFAIRVRNIEKSRNVDLEFEQYIEFSKDGLTRHFYPVLVFKLIKAIKNYGILKTAANRDQNNLRTAAERIVRIIDDRQKIGFKPGEQEYAELLEIMARDRTEGSFRRVVSMTEEFLKRARDGEEGSFFFSSHGFANIIRGFASVGYLKGVIWGYKRMIEESELLEQMARERTGDENLSKRLATASKRLQTNTPVVRILARSLERLAYREELLKLWANSVLAGGDVDIKLQRSTVRMLVQRGLLEEAIWASLIGRTAVVNSENKEKGTKGYDWSERVWVAKIIQEIMKRGGEKNKGHFERYSSSWEEAKVHAYRLKKCRKPDVVIQSTLIGGAAILGQPHLAEKLFSELVDAKMMPDPDAFTHLLALYADQGKIDKVSCILREIFSDAKSVESKDTLALKEILQKQYDTQLFVPLLYLFVKNNNVEQASELLNAWNDFYDGDIPIEKVKTALLLVYTAAGKTSLGLQAAEKIAKGTPGEVGFESKETYAYKRTYYRQKLKIYTQINHIPQLLNTLDEMARNKIVPNIAILSNIMHGFLKNGMIEMFEVVSDYFYRTMDTPVNITLYTLWLKELAKKRQAGKAYLVLRQMIERGHVPTEIHYSIVIQAYSMIGRVDQINALVREMNSPSSHVNLGTITKITLIEANVSNANLIEAHQILEDVIQNSLSLKTTIPTRAFNYLIMGYLALGYHKNALTLYTDMVELGIKPNRFTFAALIYHYAKQKDRRGCSAIVDTMIVNSIEPDAAIYSILIAIYGYMSDISSAEAAYKKARRKEAELRETLLASPSVKLSYLSKPIFESEMQFFMSKSYNPDIYADIDRDINAIPSDFKYSTLRYFDPIVMLSLLRVYAINNMLEKAKSMWDILLKAYPILTINPLHPDGPRISVTADFHSSALDSMLNCYLRLLDKIGLFYNVNKIQNLDKYLITSEAATQYVLKKSSSYLPNMKIESAFQKFNEIYSSLKSSTSSSLSSKLMNDHFEKSFKGLNSLGGDDFSKNKSVLKESLKTPEEMAFGGAGLRVDGSLEATNIKNKGTADDEAAESSLDDVNNQFGFYVPKFIEYKYFNYEQWLLSNKVVELMQNANKLSFKFTFKNVNKYISCLLVSARFQEIIDFLSKIDIDALLTDEQLQDTHLNSEFERTNLISSTNNDYLFSLLNTFNNKFLMTLKFVEKREQILENRYYNLFGTKKQSLFTTAPSDDKSNDKNDIIHKDAHGDNSSTDSNTNTDSNADNIPSLNDFITNDIVIIGLKEKLAYFYNDRNQLLAVLKVWSKLTTDKRLVRLADALES